MDCSWSKWSRKSTMVNRASHTFKGKIVNPDVIAAKINPQNKDDLVTIIQAGQQARIERNNLLEKRETFGIETTLSGHGVNKLIHTAKKQGYDVNLVYIEIK